MIILQKRRQSWRLLYFILDWKLSYSFRLPLTALFAKMARILLR
jgi:hypothetical protein